MSRRTFWLILVLITSFSLQAQKKPKETTLFTIQNTPVSTDEFLRLYKKNTLSKEDLTSKKSVEEYLDLLINFKLKVTEAKNRGLDTTAKFRNEFKTYREELKKPYRAEPDALDQVSRLAYQRLTEEIKAAHILISVKPDANPQDTLLAYQKIIHAIERVKNGESFEKVAAEISEDPSAKYNSGDLGYFTALQMVYPFEEAAYTTQPGNLSSIVRTQFGYHVLKVADRKPARGEVEVSHILLRASTPDDKEVRNKIFDVYDQLKAGRSWDDVCKEFSEDANTKNNGGRLRPFGVGALSSVPEFEAQAFSLKESGQLSDPFQSNIGWHIVRLEKKIPLPPYTEMEASLKRRLGRDERLQLSKQALSQKKKKEFGFNENTAIKNKIFEAADSSLIKGNWNAKAVEGLQNQVLFATSNQSTTVAEFVAYIKSYQTTSMLTPEAYMKQLYDACADEKLANEEDEMLQTKNPEFKNLLTEYREGIMLFDIMEKEVWNKASDDTLGQRKYYQQYASKYQGGDRLEARIFSATDRSIVDEILNKVKKGDTLGNADLKRFKTIQPFRIYEKKESKIIDQISWTVGLHDAEVDKQFYLVEVKRLVPPGVKSFDEARASVISDYQDYLEKQWLETLRKKYPVKINNKGKKVVFDQLNAK